MGVTSIAKVKAIKPAPVNATVELWRIIAMLRGAIATLKCAVEWETEREDMDTVFILEAAIDRAQNLINALDDRTVAYG